MSARSTTIVLTLGMSRPLSMMVVETSTSNMPVGEVDHDLLQRALVHLAVGHDHPGLGHQLPDLHGLVLDVGDPVVDVEDLPLPEQLPADGLGGGPVVGLADVGEDGLAVLRRRGDEAHVPDAGERHLQRAGDRRGRHGEHVDADPQLLHLLLVGDAEALLLVDDEEAEVLELDVLRQEPVGADDHVDRAALDVAHHRLGLLGGEEPGEDLDPHRVAGEALPRTSGRAGRPAAWSAPGRRPACRPAPP